MHGDAERVGTGDRAYQNVCCLSDDESGLSVMGEIPSLRKHG